MTSPRAPSTNGPSEARKRLTRLKLRLEDLLVRAEAPAAKDRAPIEQEVADVIEGLTEELLQLYQTARLPNGSPSEDQIIIEAYERVRDVLRRWRARPSALHNTLARALERMPKRQ